MKNLKIIDSGILKVKDMSKFKLFPRELGINRMVDKNNVKRIKESMTQLYITPTIKVNQDMFVLDGQHTRQAIIELVEEGLISEDYEINYEMYDTKGNDRNVCILLNTTSKKWKAEDFMEAWASIGNENYIWFKNFVSKYKLSQMTTIYIITEINFGGATKSKKFKNGELVISQEQRTKAIRIAEQLQEVKSLVPRKIARQRFFHNGFVKIALNNNYNHERMLDKLENQYDRIHKCSSQSNYAEMLNDIYNYRSKDRISLL